MEFNKRYTVRATWSVQLSYRKEYASYDGWSLAGRSVNNVPDMPIHEQGDGRLASILVSGFGPPRLIRSAVQGTLSNGYVPPGFPPTCTPFCHGGSPSRLPCRRNTYPLIAKPGTLSPLALGTGVLRPARRFWPIAIIITDHSCGSLLLRSSLKRGRLRTSGLTGWGSSKTPRYASFMASKIRMSAMYTLTLTTLSSPDPAASNTALMLFRI